MTEYLLHYVGSGLYGTKRFVNEAKRIGVQRAIPFNMLRYVTWGQTILLAEHKKVPLCQKKYHDMPLASVFSYFNVDSISYRLDDDVKAKLLEKLTVVSFQPQPPFHEQRACGDYMVGPCYFVDNSIEDIVTKIQQACQECGKSVSQFKYFIKGDIKLLDAPIFLNHTKFNRGYRKVVLDGINITQEPPKKSLFFLFDYNRRMYLKKEEAADYDRTLQAEFIEETT